MYISRFILAFLVCGCSEIDRGDMGNFRRDLNWTSYGYTTIEDPTKLAPVKTVERFELRKGDCGVKREWSDCAVGSERTEIEDMTGHRSGIVKWYGWWFYLPNDFQTIYPAILTIGQWGNTGGSKWGYHPTWHVQQFSDGGLTLVYRTKDDEYHKYFFMSDTQLRNQWHQLEFEIKWSENDDGYLNLWLNGELKLEYRGQTNNGGQNFFRYGIYRAKHPYVFKHLPWPTQVMYYANVRSGPTRASLSAPASLKQ